ncbi:rod shape-determining protein MreD [Magnetospirillum moscoviense]|uniref:Rod shape-determining protein MreD n=1 Tax=Magnetospirillum moscoviense TaxID=1437059 RepID=A0A178MV45_9PROT|nr:rod shape-determining protein MreD [Magnetospirillum moscoviense]MBF0324135.1 rod shape-determining protein MreD [Alphaproteobacteria bacterium]OAN52942.1 rod shape-determining protein MreD [Magnetospirillum moscoviense]
MKPSVWVQMDGWVRHIVPTGVTLFLLFLTAIPTHIPGLAGITPMLPMMGVYYWAIYRPDLLPAWAAFLIGLLHDIIAGTPFGVNALVMVLVQGVSASQRKFFLGKSFMVAWWAFSLLAAGASALSWLMTSILSGRVIDPGPAFFQYFLTLGLFPLLTRVLARTQMAFLKEA